MYCCHLAMTVKGHIKPEKMVKLQVTPVILVGLKNPTWSLCLAGAPLTFPTR